jgi:glycosyltransferase involved in cell wall biosynthesis
MKRVLIAHQSTIPHYRVPFYNALERIRPSSWCFDVVYNPDDHQNKQINQQTLNPVHFQFPVLAVKTYSVRIANKQINYQTFWRKAAQYDLIIVENALNNLTYPLCQLHQFRPTVKFAIWGHGRDLNARKISVLKAISEKAKLALVNKADGFFAYTPGVKTYLHSQGISPDKIFVIFNTIDIEQQRQLFEKYRPQRQRIRKQLGLTNKHVLLFVGRFTTNKRLDFLLSAFSQLHQINNQFHLLLVGDGHLNHPLPVGVSHLGSIIHPDKLATLYVASDLFVYPGAVGLAPLQAFCYDLPVITIGSLKHKPEIEYLTVDNARILATNTSPKQFAQTIYDLVMTPNLLHSWQQQVWLSIAHLTIEQMAQNFKHGIHQLLQINDRS